MALATTIKVYAPKPIVKVGAFTSVVKVEGLPGLKGNAGKDALNVSFALVSTQKIEIINNRILLSSKPEGDLLFNMMRVYDESGTTWDYDEVTIEEENGFFYATLNEPFGIIGQGVVSYLTRISA